MQPHNISWAFFGTGDDSVIVLDKMKEFGYLPNIIITTSDRPKGRGLEVKPPPIKIWAQKNNISILQYDSLKEKSGEFQKYSNLDVFVVASYNKIIPQNILSIPKYKTINIHPSLLPKLRGPSPIISAILEENETGVSIIRLTPEIDAGPILAQKKIEISWPPYQKELEFELWQTGATLLKDVFEKLLKGEVKEVSQDETKVTFSKKIKKEDALIDLNDKADINLRKIRAFHVWPGAYFIDSGKRIIIKKARVENQKLIIEKILPEGKKEMDFDAYLRGKKSQ